MTIQSRLSAILLLALCTRLASAQATVDPLAEARQLAASSQWKESESALHSYLAGHPASADAHFLLGYVLFRKHEPTESLAEFTEGAKTRRPNPAELQTVASDYVMLEDYEDADKWFTAISTETPNDATIWYLLGRTKYNEGRIEESASCFSRALSLREKYVEAENNLGLAMHELNKPEEAKAAFQHAIEWQGAVPYDAQPFLNMGSLLIEGGDFEAAIASLKQASTLSPGNPSIHGQLGTAYDALNRAPEAQAELERAVALAPNVSGLHFKLASIYKKQGMKDKARQELELCAKLNSTHSSSKTPNPPIPK